MNTLRKPLSETPPVSFTTKRESQWTHLYYLWIRKLRRVFEQRDSRVVRPSSTQLVLEVATNQPPLKEWEWRLDHQPIPISPTWHI